LPVGTPATANVKLPVETPATANAKAGVPTGFEGEVHKVQILDPASGTGTFLAEVVKHIYNNFEGQQGAWSNYVETNLLPRLNGFELLMASYAMAHLKLDMLLTETGYRKDVQSHVSTSNERFRVYLTNSLEEQHPDTQTLFASWLSDEANGANQIKRESPLMVILGNPPYAVSSSNKGEWIQKLIADYKKNLNETKINLDDDYIKFIRLGQHFIDKNGSGVLAYISNNSFIDGITHRQMRKHLLETFDKVYILNLHGSARKKEASPDGSPDQNVFDIMQGVSINIFVKTAHEKGNQLGQVYYFDLHGKREFKYKTLYENSLKSISWKKLENLEPNYFFVTKNFSKQADYEKGFKLDELFKLVGSGVSTLRDKLCIHFSEKELQQVLEDFNSLTVSEISNKYKVVDSRDWKIEEAKKDVVRNYGNKNLFQKIFYRPFDFRNTFYTGNNKGFIGVPQKKIANNLLNNNIALIIPRVVVKNFSHCLISRFMVEYSGGGANTAAETNVVPLYLYPEKDTQTEQLEYRKNVELLLEENRVIFENFKKGFLTIKKMFETTPNPDKEVKLYYKEQEKLYQKLSTNVEKFKQQLASLSSNTIFEEETRQPNLNKEIVNRIAENLGLQFVAEKTFVEPQNIAALPKTFAPIDILDYIYAVLHSPSYREKYKEFLKIDFPRVPYPCKDAKYCVSTFWQLVKLGGELRQIHLLESPVVEKFITEYPVDGNHIVTKPHFVLQNLTGFENPLGLGRVYINDNQYFDKVPEVAWNFYIGGYQPAQKWLKDRKDRKLEFTDIQHYQKIIVALCETDRLMKEIDTIEIEL